MHNWDVVCAHARNYGRLRDGIVRVYNIMCVPIAYIVQCFTITLARGIAVYTTKE